MMVEDVIVEEENDPVSENGKDVYSADDEKNIFNNIENVTAENEDQIYTSETEKLLKDEIKFSTSAEQELSDSEILVIAAALLARDTDRDFKRRRSVLYMKHAWSRASYTHCCQVASISIYCRYYLPQLCRRGLLLEQQKFANVWSRAAEHQRIRTSIQTKVRQHLERRRSDFAKLRDDPTICYKIAQKLLENSHPRDSNVVSIESSGIIVGNEVPVEEEIVVDDVENQDPKSIIKN
ncbi:unnamed protein product [Caenorhabditis auriculariae]|uniref:Uncharacterized protein n=1 Tax=Caenorhabditis auriculariae TaxID=2777116 RepID=A0A8S1GWS2_9PELO|nr:unnamed protein product [Caenorhabditis auriculariae]